MQNDFAALNVIWVQSKHYIELTPRQIATLALVCDRSMSFSPSELAVELNVQRSIISRCLRALLKYNLIERSLRVDDRRISIIAPTDTGRQLRATLASLGQ